MSSIKVTCACTLILEPLKWKEDRLLWCCPKIPIPTTMQLTGRKKRIEVESQEEKGEEEVKSQEGKEQEYSHCETVVEFLNGNDKSRVWHQFKSSTVSNLVELCSLKLNQPIPFDYKIFIDMVHCLNGYDTTMEDCYQLATKKRNANNLKPLAGPPKKKRRVISIKNQKLDADFYKNQLFLKDFRSVTVSITQSETLKRKLEQREIEEAKRIKKECKLCRCELPTYLEKRVVKEYDYDGNRKQNAGKGYWACDKCKFFLWEDVVFEFYSNVQ
jgi:hypothetical protein